MPDSVESLANRFIELVITKNLKFFLENDHKTHFLNFINERVDGEDQVFIRKLLNNSSITATPKKFIIPYEVLLEMIEQALIWKYRWTHAPFEFKYREEEINSQENIQNAQENIQNPQKDKYEYRRNILHHAAMLGDADIFKEIVGILKSVGMLEQALFKYDPDKKRPFYYAIKNDSAEIVAACVEGYQGELWSQFVNEKGKTVLEYAFSKDNPDVIAALKPKQQTWKQILSKTLHEKPLLHLAIERQTIKFLEYLAQQDVDWELRDQNDNSTLHNAVTTGNLAIVKLIFSQNNVLLNSTNEPGHTPIGWAILEIYKPYLNEEGRRRPAIQLSEEAKHKISQFAEIVKYLLSEGALLKSYNKDHLAAAIKSHPFLEVNSDIQAVLKYVRWELNYRTATGISVICSALLLVAGITFVLTGDYSPIVWGVPLADGLILCLSIYAVQLKFRKVFPILERLEQILETVNARLHSRSSALSTFEIQPQMEKIEISDSEIQDPQFKPEVGCGTAAIQNNLRKEREVVIDLPETKTAKLQQKSLKLYRDLHIFLPALKNELENMPGAPRLEISQLIETLRADNCFEIKKKLKRTFKIVMSSPQLSSATKQFLEDKYVEIEPLGKFPEMIAITALRDVKVAMDSDSDSENEQKSEPVYELEFDQRGIDLRFP